MHVNTELSLHQKCFSCDVCAVCCVRVSVCTAEGVVKVLLLTASGMGCSFANNSNISENKKTEEMPYLVQFPITKLF